MTYSNALGYTKANQYTNCVVQPVNTGYNNYSNHTNCSHSYADYSNQYSCSPHTYANCMNTCTNTCANTCTNTCTHTDRCNDSIQYCRQSYSNCTNAYSSGYGYSACSNRGAAGYTDYFNSSCGQCSNTCTNFYTYSGYSNASSGNYTNVARYIDTYYCTKSYADSYTNNYINNSVCTQSYSASAYTNCNQSYADHSNCTDTGYANHSNYLWCSQSYTDHRDDAHAAPAAYTVALPVGIDNWTTLYSAIPDIKKLREEIKRLAVTKVKKGGSVFTAADDAQIKELYNRDEDFSKGKETKVEQIQETIANIDYLWKAIKGTSSGLPAIKRGDLMKKSDYQAILDRVTALAGTAQPPSDGYVNHANTSCGHHINYGNYSDVGVNH